MAIHHVMEFTAADLLVCTVAKRRALAVVDMRGDLL